MRSARLSLCSAGAVIAVGLACPVPSAGQASLGQFAWQLHPYCNVIVVSATPDGPGFRLEGFDDQCGAARRAPLAGTATQNPDGTIAFAFVVITSDGRGNPTAAALNPGTFGGTWVDSAGLTGTLVFGAPRPAAGSPRPAPQMPAAALAPNAVTNVTIADGTVGASDVNAAQVQLRVQGTCPTGLYFVGVDVGGSVVCSDGSFAAGNVALGLRALESDRTGSFNTAIGHSALVFHTGGSGNTAIGNSALIADIEGAGNTGVGVLALASNTSGDNNVAIGHSALISNIVGTGNIAIGTGAGRSITGDTNIAIGNFGVRNESNTIRIGIDAFHSRTFIAGIRNRITGSANGVSVLIDGNGQLGTISSSRRVKEDIADMGEASTGLLRLRPVTFRYTQRYADGSMPLDYGLIAEEVAEVYPDLVVRDDRGDVDTVQYHKLIPMLLNELQRLQRTVDALTTQVAALETVR